MLIKIAIGLLVIAGLALGGEMTLTSALVEELSRKTQVIEPQPTAVIPTHAAGIPCAESRNHRRKDWRKACIA